MEVVTAGIVMTIQQNDAVTTAEGPETLDAFKTPLEGQPPETPSGDEDVLKYFVELKLPRRQKSKIDRQLQNRIEQAAGLNSDHDALGIQNGVVGEDLPAPAELITDLVEIKEDTCRSNNWTSYFSYQRQRSKDGTYFDSSPHDFDDDTSSKEMKAFTMKKDYKAVIRLTISSPYVREYLLRAIGIEFYNGVSIGASNTVLDWPFSPLYHHLGVIRANIHNDQNATKAQRNDIDALHYFVTEGAPAKLYKDVRSKIAQGFIIYDELWALFKPGDFAVVRDPVGNDDISQIISVKWEISRGNFYGVKYFWYITLLKIAWKGGQFRRVSTRWRMEIFTGSRKISDLQICPLWSRQDKESLKDAAIQQGKLWKKLCEGEPTTMMYEGQALCLLTEEPLRPDYNMHDREGAVESEYKTFNLSSVVVVDPNARSKAVLQGGIDIRRHLQHPTFGIDNTTWSRIDSEFSNEEYMICPASITVFTLDNQEWCNVSINNLKPKEWKPATFDRLVLDSGKKETLTRLAKTNSRRIQSKKSVDIIEGKGRGIVLLLHGPPGVGKTLTAEVLSEFTERPLLKVNLGRVANHRKWEQALEQIFINAEDWKAILLIDEAEIVLEKRTFESMIHNSWISVFLRKLEYYKGILILTTNLIDCIDEAFESRISYAVRFRDLSRDDRRQIWMDFIKDMKIFPAYKEALLNDVDRWSEAEINGRQIRNIILMAENLAASDEEHPRLTPSHVDKLLNSTLEFCDYNRGNANRTSKIQLTGPSY